MTGMPQTKLFRWVVMMKKYVFSNNILFILYNYLKKKKWWKLLLEILGINNGNIDWGNYRRYDVTNNTLESK